MATGNATILRCAALLLVLICYPRAADSLTGHPRKGHWPLQKLRFYFVFCCVFSRNISCHGHTFTIYSRSVAARRHVSLFLPVARITMPSSCIDQS